MKSLRAIGFRRAIRYLLWSVAYRFGYRLLCLSPLRVLWLRMAGATIGPDAVVMDVRLFNLDRSGVRQLHIGRDSFLGDECLLDMAGPIVLGDQVTLAERVTIITHMNVGYADHPLQPFFPPRVEAVSIANGAYIGTGAIILPGVRVGARAVIGAGSVVTRDVQPEAVAVGTPARVVRHVRHARDPRIRMSDAREE